MFSSKNIQMNERKNGSKVTRYAIKKLSMGTASVAVALGFMFVQGQTIVHADTVEATSAETTAKPAEEKKDTVEDDKAVYEVAVEKAEATTAAEGVTPAEKTEETTAVAEKTEETTAVAEKKEETTSATEKAEATTAAPEKKEESTVAEENKPRTRSKRAVAEGTASNDTVGENVVDATSTPKEEKPGFTPKILADQLLKQVSWLDFGDKANWTGTETTADGHLALTVGATYTKEVMPGYIVKIKVKSLKPFQATEIYKKRMEEQGATAEEKATYDPNAKNGYINSITNPKTNAAFKNKEEARVIADPQNRWTEIRQEGIDTGTKSTTISSEYDGGNIGVQFDISATYKGKAVKPAIVMADGESANPGELALFTTNGTGWQHIGEWLKNNNKNTKNYVPQDTDHLFDPANNYSRSKPVNVEGVNITGQNLELLRKATAVGEEGKIVAWKYYGNPDKTTGGLGTGVFGPNVSSSTIAVPMVMTRGASEIGLYIASSGKQSAMLGFLPLDEGDAPESYGMATHAMNQVNGVTGAAVNQPYLGDTRPDMDENLERTDWKGDDKDGTGDEGIDQILPTDLKGNTNGMIALERTRPGNYTLTIQANTGGASEAYLYGWVDFNQNGKFDENERSEKTTITKDGKTVLTFNNGPILSDLQLDKLGVRVRVSTYAPDIESPTGMSMSGEVEDFETQVIFPPKGSKKETTNLQGVKQTATVEFTAQGKQRYSRTEDAVIDETVAPFIVDDQGNKVALDDEGYYVVSGEGKYRVTGAGKDVKVEFIPENGFVGTARGITIRRLDNNGVDTGWNTKDNSQPVISDQTNTMDGRYIPTVTPLSDEVTSEDLQGIEHDKQLTFTNGAGEVKPSAATPMVIVNPETGGLIGNEAPAMKDGKVVGLYEIDPINGTVKFTPNKDFIGTPDPVLIQVVEEATGRTLAGIKYTPTVNPVTPVGENKETTGKQGQPQSDTVTFKQQSGAEEKVPMVVNAENPAKFIDPATGEPTDATELPAMKDGKQVGTYTIDPATGKVTFTPNKDFVGTPDAISVQAKDANGTPATATYTPTVTPVTPTGEDKTTTGKQGQVQKETVKFTEGDSEVPMKIDADQPAKFIDPATGEPTDATELPAMKDGKQVGTYKLDPLTGEVTFTPNKDFVGTPDGISVQAKDANGTPATAKYTPTVTAVTPTGEDKTTTGKQGQVQKETPKFTEGDSEVPMKIDADQPAKFIDPATGEPTDETTLPAMKDGKQVGTYKLDPLTGEVTFTPNKDFVGTPEGITVQAKDANGTPATATYTPTVTPVTPTGEDKTTTGKQGQVQKETPKFTEGDSEVPMKIDADQPAKFIDPATGEPTDATELPAMKDGKQVGTYKLDPLTGEVTFTPNKDFVGTPEGITVQAKDANGTPATATYTPTVTPVTPTGEDKTTTGKQGQVQKETVTFTEGDSDVPMKIDADQPAKFIDPATGEPTDETTLPAMKDGKQVGTYTIDPTTGEVTFTPNKDFVGTPDGITVQAKDANGTPATAKYTPTVTAVTPTAEDVTSTGKQGQVQKETPKFTEGDAEVPMKIDADQPAKFIDPATGEPTDETTLPAMKDGKQVGTYTIDPLTGEVTFTPNKDFVGTPDGITVQAKDANGTPVTATYTPTVTPVTPTAEDAETTDVQGKTQTAKPKFTEGDSDVPLDDTVPATFEDGSITKVIPGVGTFTVAPDGTITFVPEPNFTGVAPVVTIQRVDVNGTVAKANYVATVTPVTPTGEDKTTTGKQGQVQKETVKFTEGDSEVPMKIDADQPAKFIDPATGEPTDATELPAMKDGKQVGTYTIDPLTGEVTFTPNKDFVGTPEGITVQAKDANGTPATATYTPTVTAVTPTGEDKTTTGKQGQVQKETPKFTEGDSEVPMKIDADQPAKFIDPATGEPTDATELPAMKDGKQVGTYKLDPLTGEVTFTPNKDFVGTPEGITVQAKDANGTPATAKYTPTVTPVTPTAEDAETTDVQGKTQTAKPKFTEGDSDVPLDDTVPATFEDGSTTKVIPGVGTFTVAPDGTITFVPEPNFTGVAPVVTIQRVDVNGTVAKANYVATVTPVTPTGEDKTTTGKQGQKQKQTPKFTEGDPVAPITINADQPAKFIDPTTGEPTDATELPAMKDGKQVGTYTIDPTTGEVTFTPNKDFVGTPDGITVQAKDANGTPVTAKYTPTVTPVTPTAEDAETTDVQGKTQTAKPKFTEGDSDVPLDDTVPATFEDGSTTKVIPGVGTFTVAPDGTITFVPEPNFTGVAPAVTIQRVDVNGTVVKANYVATVTPAPAKPVEVEPTTTTPEPAKPQQELPNTGTSDEYGVFSAAALSILASVGLVATSRKKDEEQEA